MTPEEFLKKKGYYAGSLMLSKVKGQGLVSIAQAMQEYADEVIAVTRCCESDSELLRSSCDWCNGNNQPKSDGIANITDIG